MGLYNFFENSYSVLPFSYLASKYFSIILYNLVSSSFVKPLNAAKLTDS